MLKNEEKVMDEVTQALIEIRNVEEKFRKIQENPALNGAENGFTNQELKILQQLINSIGVANIAADAILKRASA